MIPPLENKRFFVKIKAGPGSGGNPCIYFNSGFVFSSFLKWRWFFDYRAALYKIKHPRHNVDICTGFFMYEPPKQEKISNLKNAISGKKRSICNLQNKIKEAKSSFSDLFMTIEETPGYKKAIITLDTYQNNLIEMEEQLKQLLT